MDSDRQLELWSDVDDYLEDVFGGEDSDAARGPRLRPPAGPAGRRCLAGTGAVPRHARPHDQGALHPRDRHARRPIRPLHLARATGPEGEVVTLEYDPHHAAVARDNLARAGLSDRVEVGSAPPPRPLPLIYEELRPKFDFVFIDADKPNNALYLEWALKLARPGAIVVVDNVIRDGKVIEAHSTDPSVIGARAALAFIAGARSGRGGDSADRRRQGP